jgi:hypothetical protein
LNDDGFVGQTDLDIVLSYWGQNVKAGDWLMGDPSGDGFVGQTDLDWVLANWGQGTWPSAGMMHVPEPATGALLSVWVAAMALGPRGGHRRRKSQNI